MNGDYFLLLLIVSVVFGYIGRYISKEKNRDKTEGFLFGFFLSIFGLIILGLLPTKEPIINNEVLEENEPIIFKDSQTKKELDDERSMYVKFIIVIIIGIISFIIYSNQ